MGIDSGLLAGSEVSTEVILDSGDYCVLPICLGQLSSEPRQGVLAVHSVKPVGLRRRTASWRQLADAVCCGVRQKGKGGSTRSILMFYSA